MQLNLNKKHAWFLLPVFILAVLVFKDELKVLVFKANEKRAEIVQSIEKVSQPGVLISKLESAKAYLTNQGVFNFTNVERYANSLSALKPSEQLNKVAQERLDDMFEKQYFEHVSPAGESASTVATDIGYEYITIGENIALGNFDDDKAVVTAWMNSPGHRANILNPSFHELGVAVGKGKYKGRDTWLAVQIFARSISECSSPNTTLKAEIDSKTKQLESLDTAIKLLGEQLEQAKREGDKNAYNQKVSEYNSLVKEYNTLRETLKASINEYNISVREFNECIKG